MKRQLVFYPFLYGVFMVLSLYATNISEYPLQVIVWPLIHVMAGTLLGLLITWRIFKSPDKAGLLVFVFLFFFLSFSHMRALLPDVGFYIGQQRIHTAHFLVLGVTSLLGAMAIWLRKSSRRLLIPTLILNLFTVILVLMPSARIIYYLITSTNSSATTIEAMRPVPEIDVEVSGKFPGPLPNVFHIVLDGYGRDDLLKAVYGHNNSALTDGLEERGFFVATKSTSNYSHTVFSLGSALNMEYLDWMADEVEVDFRDLSVASKYFRRNKVRDFFQLEGYKFASIGTGYSLTEIFDADIYVNAYRQRDEFRRGFWNLTPIKIKKSELERRRILQGFESLPILAESPDPLYLLSHIIAPHPPFVFDSAGEPIDNPKFIGMISANHLTNENMMSRAEYKQKYIDQLIFVNRILFETIDEIFARSFIPPIIIIQGDHGSGAFLCHSSLNDTYLKDRMSILYAVYLPGKLAVEFPDNVTPVNTYRYILNLYFNQDLALLENRNYFSSILTPYDFIDVTNDIGTEADHHRYNRLLVSENSGGTLTGSGEAGIVCPIER